jgi:hypothetical protein
LVTQPGRAAYTFASLSAGWKGFVAVFMQFSCCGFFLPVTQTVVRHSLLLKRTISRRISIVTDIIRLIEGLIAGDPTARFVLIFT